MKQLLKLSFLVSEGLNAISLPVLWSDFKRNEAKKTVRSTQDGKRNATECAEPESGAELF